MTTILEPNKITIKQLSVLIGLSPEALRNYAYRGVLQTCESKEKMQDGVREQIMVDLKEAKRFVAWYKSQKNHRRIAADANQQVFLKKELDMKSIARTPMDELWGTIDTDLGTVTIPISSMIGFLQHNLIDVKTIVADHPKVGFMVPVMEGE